MNSPNPNACAAKIVQHCREAAEDYEFTTYVVGVAGKRTLAPLGDGAADWKLTVKGIVGRELGDGWEALGRRPEFQRAEIVFVYDLDRDALELRVRSVYLYARYRKLQRGLPQTRARWRCPECAGAGCEACAQTGRRYPVSVEDLIGGPIAARCGGPSDGYQLHGMGREDVDVLCVGEGRPFVLEVKSPRRRSIDLEVLPALIAERSAGRVELAAPPRVVAKALVARVKAWEADKTYLALCEATGAPFQPERVAGLSGLLGGVELAQRTPERVSRRRADKVRRRVVRRFVPRNVGALSFEAEVEAQSGTYIKELISGDEGRTTPSVSSLLGGPCVCARLDVLAIHASDETLLGP